MVRRLFKNFEEKILPTYLATADDGCLRPLLVSTPSKPPSNWTVSLGAFFFEDLAGLSTSPVLAMHTSSSPVGLLTYLLSLSWQLTAPLPLCLASLGYGFKEITR